MSISFDDCYYDFNEILRFNWCMLVNCCCNIEEMVCQDYWNCTQSKSKLHPGKKINCTVVIPVIGEREYFLSIEVSLNGNSNNS